MKIGIKAKLYHGVILDHLQKTGMSLKELSEYMGICYQTLNGLYRFRLKMSVYYAEKIAEAIGVLPEEILNVQLPANAPRDMLAIKDVSYSQLDYFQQKEEQKLLTSIEHSEILNKLKILLQHLSYRERLILKRKIGVFGEEKYSTRKDIAKSLKISEERARQIEAGALYKLKCIIQQDRADAVIKGQSYFLTEEEEERLFNVFRNNVVGLSA